MAIGEFLGSLLGEGIGFAGDMYWQNEKMDLSRLDSRAGREAMRARTALSQLEGERAEKQRRFQRLIELLSAGEGLQKNRAGAHRLMALRNSGRTGGASPPQQMQQQGGGY